MPRYQLRHTGLPHLLVVLVIVLVVMHYEGVLLDQAENARVISISSSGDDGLEAMELTTSETVSADQMQLVRSLLKSADIRKSAESNSDIHRFPEKERHAFYAALSRALFASRHYGDVVHFLNLIPQEERVGHDVQFMYAFSLAKTGSQDDAIAQYKLLIERQPNTQSANLNLALLFRESKRCQQAIPIFEHAISITSGKQKAKALSGLADCKLSSGDGQAAIGHYSKSLEYRPDLPDTWAKLGDAYAYVGQVKEALDAYDKSIALNASDYRGYLHRANYCLSRYDIVGAIDTLKKATSLSNSLKIRELLAWAYIEDGSRHSARRTLSYLIEHATSQAQITRATLMRLYVNRHYDDLLAELKKIKKPNDDIQYLKGLTYRRLGYFDSAFKVFEKLQGNRRYMQRALIQEARMIRARQQYPAALEKYEALLGNSPNANALWFESALIHENLLQTKQGINKIDRALSIEPDNPVYTLTKARLLKLDGRMDAAIDLLESLLSRKPKYARGHRLMAQLLMEKSDISGAINAYRRLLQLETDDYDAMFEMAKAQIRIGDMAAAQLTLKRILNERSEHVEARYLLAETHYKLGDYSKCLKELDNLLNLDPSNSKGINLRAVVAPK